MMRIALIITAAIVIVVIVIVAIGAALPVRHQAQRQANFAASPEALRAILLDVEHYPTWRTGVTQVTVLDHSGSVTHYREQSSDGAIEYRLDASDPDALTSRITGGVTAFGGGWHYRLVPGDHGTMLRITEDGEIYNPIFRFVSRYVMGYTATMDRYLRDLDARVRRDPTSAR